MFSCAQRCSLCTRTKIGDVTVILCEGRMVGGDAAFKLRDEVKRQKRGPGCSLGIGVSRMGMF
jgi:hypothetical protein